MYVPTKCCEIIVACFMMHNICIEHNLPLDDDDDDDDEDDDEDDDDNVGGVNINHGDGAHAHNTGALTRRQLINDRFQ